MHQIIEIILDLIPIKPSSLYGIHFLMFAFSTGQGLYVSLFCKATLPRLFLCLLYRLFREPPKWIFQFLILSFSFNLQVILCVSFTNNTSNSIFMDFCYNTLKQLQHTKPESNPVCD